MTDSVPVPVQALLDLFTAELGDVKFPDMDADILTRATEEVIGAAEMVTRAELALDAARAALIDKQESLLTRAQRALAYARVFAEERPDLALRIDAIALPRVRRAKLDTDREASLTHARSVTEDVVPPRRRGPKPKQQVTDSPTSLFEASASQSSQAQNA